MLYKYRKQIAYQPEKRFLQQPLFIRLHA